MRLVYFFQTLCLGFFMFISKMKKKEWKLWQETNEKTFLDFLQDWRKAEVVENLLVKIVLLVKQNFFYKPTSCCLPNLMTCWSSIWYAIKFSPLEKQKSRLPPLLLLKKFPLMKWPHGTHFSKVLLPSLTWLPLCNNLRRVLYCRREDWFWGLNNTLYSGWKYKNALQSK